MFIDHLGVLFFPRVTFLRIIGRLAFPIFAYLIAEGCKHTKNRLRYFLTLSVFGALFQLVYFLFTGSSYMNIFITYSLAVPMIYALQFLKQTLANRKVIPVTAAFLILAASIVFAYLFHSYFTVDYGFAGSLVPFAASVCMTRSSDKRKTDNLREHLLSVLVCGISLFYLSAVSGGTQIYCLFALPLLLAYSGKRGKASLKYFFYVFYPAHLVLLYGAAELLIRLG